MEAVQNVYMNEGLPKIDYTKIETESLDLDKLQPIEGKIILTEGRPSVNAVYFQDRDGRVIAYLTYAPYWGSTEEVVVESFTNEAVRQKGLQEKLNSYLIRFLRRSGYKKIIGHIMMDNSRSFLNRLKTKDPDSSGVLKAEIDGLEDLDMSQPIDPVYLDVTLDLNQTVVSNEVLLKKIIDLQAHLTTFRMGPPIAEILSDQNKS